MKFVCDQCGECCRNLNLSEIYSDLDSGNGTCKFLDGNICSIYESRPVKCRIDDCYDLYFADEMSKEEYYQKNHEMCEALKQRAEQKKA